MCVCYQQAACINIPPAAQSDIRVLMVLYSSRKRSFVGLIPTDQTQFINAIRTLIQNQRKKVACARDFSWPLSVFSVVKTYNLVCLKMTLIVV